MPKTWIITGSSRGLGRALAEAALAAGKKVAATARRVDGLKDLKYRYRDQVLLLPLDVTDETQTIEAVTPTIRTFGRLDVLVIDSGRCFQFLHRKGSLHKQRDFEGCRNERSKICETQRSGSYAIGKVKTLVRR